MRYNHFGDTYCHSAEEVLTELSDNEVAVGDVYLAEINGPENGETMWCGDVSDNVTGDTALYIEAESRDAVAAIAKTCGIEDKS